MTLTVADYFCGAGGSSTGMQQVPGVRVVMAANHWQLAVDTHQANFPHADHDREDITRIDPRRHPRTDLGWFSPECTNWSVAKGRKVDYDGKPVQLDLLAADDEPLPDEAAMRSRMLMQDMPRFTEVHRYRAVIVENVTDVLKWQHLDEWLRRMANLGYAHRTVVLNSAFASALGPGAPQLRDRVYFVFWRDTYAAPDFAKWTRPLAWCPRCGTDVRAVHVDKRPGVRRTMRYGQQYLYRCPHTTCRGAAIAPYALPAAAVIDWTVPGRRIGDRAEPLKPKTLHRIRAGLAAYGTPLLTPAGGTWNTGARPVGEPMRARTTRESDGLLCPPMLVPVDGRHGKHARPVGEPTRAQTARAENALVIPLRNNGVAKPVDASPWLTFAAGGTHQALLYGYGTGTLRSVAAAPLPAQTTVQGDALLSPAVHVDQCTFRMLTVDEIRAGMAFTPGYTLLGSAKRAKVRMLGNAVTPPAARDLMAAVAEAITGEAIEPAA
jgi:DNA (cytosine-5)-methyltransferase 1